MALGAPHVEVSKELPRSSVLGPQAHFSPWVVAEIVERSEVSGGSPPVRVGHSEWDEQRRMVGAGPLGLR